MSPEAARCLRLLPYGATGFFLVLMAIAEYQVRTSPKWPPPAKHELGGWQIEDPAVWTFAGALNLPATIPMLWAWQFSDRATYLMDDHSLFIYLPWTVLVFLMWYCVRWRLQLRRKTRRSTLLALLMQTFITIELVSVAVAAIETSAADHRQRPPIVVIGFFCMWSLAAIIGWTSLFGRTKVESTR